MKKENDDQEIIYEWYDVGSLSCRCGACGCKNNEPIEICPKCGNKLRVPK